MNVLYTEAIVVGHHVKAATLCVGSMHHDVIKWKHFSRYWPFVWGIHRSPLNSTHKGQWRGALVFHWATPWIQVWVKDREAGDVRCHRAHYDVIERSEQCLSGHPCYLGISIVPDWATFVVPRNKNTSTYYRRRSNINVNSLVIHRVPGALSPGNILMCNIVKQWKQYKHHSLYAQITPKSRSW